jgi:hypothetical protein
MQYINLINRLALIEVETMEKVFDVLFSRKYIHLHEA